MGKGTPPPHTAAWSPRRVTSSSNRVEAMPRACWQAVPKVVEVLMSTASPPRRSGRFTFWQKPWLHSPETGRRISQSRATHYQQSERPRFMEQWRSRSWTPHQLQSHEQGRGSIPGELADPGARRGSGVRAQFKVLDSCLKKAAKYLDEKQSKDRRLWRHQTRCSLQPMELVRRSHPRPANARQRWQRRTRASASCAELSARMCRTVRSPFLTPPGPRTNQPMTAVITIP